MSHILHPLFHPIYITAKLAHLVLKCELYWVAWTIHCAPSNHCCPTWQWKGLHQVLCFSFEMAHPCLVKTGGGCLQCTGGAWDECPSFPQPDWGGYYMPLPVALGSKSGPLEVFCIYEIHPYPAVHPRGGVPSVTFFVIVKFLGLSFPVIDLMLSSFYTDYYYLLCISCFFFRILIYCLTIVYY